MKFCRLENYSCQGKTPTSDLTACLAPSSNLFCVSHSPPPPPHPILHSYFTNFLSFMWKTTYVWHELFSLSRSGEQPLNVLVCSLWETTLQGMRLNHITQLFCFSIRERFYFLIALKFSWTLASKRHIHCWSVTAINISSPIPSSQERGINQLSVLLYLWVNEWKSHCSL